MQHSTHIRSLNEKILMSNINFFISLIFTGHVGFIKCRQEHYIFKHNAENLVADVIDHIDIPQKDEMI